MPINAETSGSPNGTDVYLFAHQDDEFGVFHAIDRGVAVGRRSICIFLTDGGGLETSPTIRNRESLSVLTKLGVDPKDVHFVGAEHGIKDGNLVSDLPRARALIMPILTSLPGPLTVISHTWEGGHPDHDAAHLLARWCARDLGLSSGSQRFFALYNADRMPGPFFRVLAPLEEHGTLFREAIPWPARFRHLRLYLTYRSQWRSLVGLYPFIVWYYLVSGKQVLQQPSAGAPAGRPHPGPLLYEKRQGLPYEDFLSRLPSDLPVTPTS